MEEALRWKMDVRLWSVLANRLAGGASGSSSDDPALKYSSSEDSGVIMVV